MDSNDAQRRDAVRAMYPLSPRWIRRVNLMPGAQVLAIYNQNKLAEGTTIYHRESKYHRRQPTTPKKEN